ncbi:MAG: FAD-dependent oxidoreductase [Actinomycetota bacterium]|nr:FAD-dependent oxidoreductase [Actinomycetota bacterium]
MTLVRKGTLYGDREPRGGEEVTSGEIAAATASIGAGIAAGGGSVVGALARCGLRGAVAEAVRARVEVSCAHPAEDLDESVLRSAAAAFGDFDSYGLEGGNGTLIDALADGLGEALHLEAPVMHVSWSRRMVRVAAGDGTEAAADAAVIAVPPTVVGSIDFDPTLPSGRLSAMRELRLGQAAKLFVALRSPALPSATLSVPGRFWCYTQLGSDGAPVPFVAAFAGTPAALEALGVRGGPETWLAALAALRPDLDLDPTEVLLSRWDDDPWVRGAYSACSLGSPLGSEELAAPVGPLHFAGEHTAGEFHGLMEGALISGRRAASEITGR